MNLKVRLYSNQDGFTFLEVLVAIAIMSISSFAIWNGVHGGLNVLEKIVIKSRITADLALFEKLFRDSINDISTPYWVDEYTLADLSLYNENEILTFELHDIKHQFKSLTLVEIEEQEHGMQVRLKTERDSIILVYARYGSFHLSGDL